MTTATTGRNRAVRWRFSVAPPGVNRREPRRPALFFAISEFGSMSEAAEQLHGSQSTLVRQMQALATKVGGQLMERGHRESLAAAIGSSSAVVAPDKPALSAAP